MIDKITARIRRYPFQTGIVVGVVICLILVGFFSLFQDHGKTLSGNSEIIREDYLRMTINQFSQDRDDLLAAWRFDHLGKKGTETLKLMRADESVAPWDLVNFTEALENTKDLLDSPAGSAQKEAGTPTNPRKGLSGFGKVLLIILGLGVVCAGGLYAASLIQTRKKQKRREEISSAFDEDRLNMITPEKAESTGKNEPDTLFDLDSLFPSNDENKKDSAEEQDPLDVLKITSDENNDFPAGSGDEKQENKEDDLQKDEPAAETDILNEIENLVFGSDEETNDEDRGREDPSVNDAEAVSGQDEAADAPQDAEKDTDEQARGPEETSGLDYETSVHPYEDRENRSESSDFLPDEENAEAGEAAQDAADETVPADVQDDVKEDAASGDAEKPLVETDPGSEQENEDELLKMIRAGKQSSEDLIEKTVTAEIDLQKDAVDEVTAEEPETEEPDPDEADQNESPEDEVLIHYQSVYRVGNDMYDEVFSIDQGDVFRGECGIGIGETLNNTEPKAVTAFEIWLFDKDDIHTATWYLMSDFALSNEGICSRLEQRGKCDRIRKGDLYTLETETLAVEIRILDLEYGNEMEEKNSYFTNVVFDIVAKNKISG